MQTHYQILGVPPAAEYELIHQNYKAKSLLLHPDMGGSEGQFVALRDAWEILKDPKKRQVYNDMLKLTMEECTVCNGQGVIWRQKGFTNRAALICNACDGVGYE